MVFCFDFGSHQEQPFGSFPGPRPLRGQGITCLASPCLWGLPPLDMFAGEAYMTDEMSAQRPLFAAQFACGGIEWVGFPITGDVDQRFPW